MGKLQIFLFSIKFQFALSCFAWIFPELPNSGQPTNQFGNGDGTLGDSVSGCCKQKEIGGYRYTLIGTENTEEFDCTSYCVYRKAGEVNSKYCFKQGGDIYPVCLDIAGTDCMGRYNESLSTVNYNLNRLDVGILHTIEKENLTRCSQDQDCKPLCHCQKSWCMCPGVVLNVTQTLVLHEILKIHLMLGKHERNVLVNASACSPLRVDCDICFEAATRAVAYCEIHGDVYTCNNYGKLAKRVCKSCFYQFFEACNNSSEHKTDNLKSIANNSEEQEPDGHQCDRNCTDSHPMTCVFNLKLEMLYSDTAGRQADGRNRTVLAYNGKVPGPAMVVCEGDKLVVHLANNIDKTLNNIDGYSSTTTLHFHGIRQKYRPWADGVPFVSQCPISPGENFTYGFNASFVYGAPAGTYWYHSHVGEQRINGAYGALIIKPNDADPDSKSDVDDAPNIIILQEWYHSANSHTVASLLINGHGRIGNKISVPLGKQEELKYLTGSGKEFSYSFKDFNETDKPNYTTFVIKNPGKKYKFRVIGAISQNFPLRLSIDDHKFTAVAADSRDIIPVHNITDLWIAGGERFDIVIQTKKSGEEGNEPYKIRVFGYGNTTTPSTPFCTIAWLKYSGQTINKAFVTDHKCIGFDLEYPRRTLNHITNNNNAWKERLQFPDWLSTNKTGDIFIKDLRATVQQPSIHVWERSEITTKYVEFVGNQTMNNIRFSNSDVPILLQNSKNQIEANQCGTEVEFKVNQRLDKFTTVPYITTNFTDITGKGCTEGDYCLCQHVLKVPYASAYWTEFVLINNKKSAIAHPIHQHGGWFWVVGMGQFDHDITAEEIRTLDTNCTAYTTDNGSFKRTHCLPRNFELPPAKDTIQVPPGGYVIYRIELDNEGAWIMHCHINWHVLAGMAMVVQIGGLQLDPPNLGQNWCTGILEKNTTCKEEMGSLTGGKSSIEWKLPMHPAKRCILPGNNLTFYVRGHHNINVLSEKDYNSCTVNNDTNADGIYVWTAPPEKNTYYIACGMYNGGHCNDGMKVKITVDENCLKL